MIGNLGNRPECLHTSLKIRIVLAHMTTTFLITTRNPECRQREYASEWSMRSIDLVALRRAQIHRKSCAYAAIHTALHTTEAGSDSRNHAPHGPHQLADLMPATPSSATARCRGPPLLLMCCWALFSAAL